MNAQSSTPEPAASSGASANPIPAAQIDRSCQLPVLFLIGCAAAWLVIGLLFGVLSSIKLHGPGFLAGSEWSTYGRLYPVSRAALAFGFASQAALALAIWMIARLGRTLVVGPVAITLGAALWNGALAIGIFGILAGNNTGYEWFELPGSVGPAMFVSFGVIGVCALIMLHRRHEPTMYVSQWYLLAALLWFPWVFSTSYLLLFQWPVRGVMQEIVNSWFAHNFFSLWLTPVSLAAIFYFIPKLLGRPLHSEYLAMFGFWTLALFGGWVEVQSGTPVPKWIASVSTVAAVLLLIPLMAVLINWHHTLRGQYAVAWQNPVLRFFVFGAAMFALVTVLQALGSARSVSRVTGLTFYDIGIRELFLFGFVGMVSGGSLVYMLPRLTENRSSASFAGWYFWLMATGSLLSGLSLVLGGVVQGLAIHDASVGFLQIVKRTVPFIGINTVGNLLLLGANLGLAVVLGKEIARCCGCCCVCAPEQPRLAAAGRKA